MTPTETKLIEEGVRNEELALLEWVRTWEIVDKYFWMYSNEQLLDRFKNRNK